MQRSSLRRSLHSFSTVFDRAPDFYARAPGRVNLIGGHTDYNDGFVLPLALPFDTVITVGAAADQTTAAVELHSEDREPIRFTPGDDPDSVTGWGRYVLGAARVFLRRFPEAQLGGWDGTIASDIPVAAGLSSSAALEVASLLTFARIAGIAVPGIQIAAMGQQVENEVMGLSSGIMDQLISATAVKGHASLIDCRSLASEPRQVPATDVIVVIDTKTRRELVDSAYDDRRNACERVAAQLAVSSLRDVDGHDLLQLEPSSDRNRASHVVSENERTLQAAEALAAGDGSEVGRLMSASHASLRDLYEVSSDELNLAVETAQNQSGCLGARLTGAGFGGCCVALVRQSEAIQFVVALQADYEAATGTKPNVWVCEPAAGAETITL